VLGAIGGNDVAFVVFVRCRSNNAAARSPAGPALPEPGYSDRVADACSSTIVVSEGRSIAVGAALNAVAGRTLHVGVCAAADFMDWAT